MDPYMSVLFMFTTSFPEAMLITYFAIQFMGGRPRLPDILLIGLIQAVVAYIVRSLPIPFGLHTVILLVSFAALIHLIARVPLAAASIGTIAGFLVLVLIEPVVNVMVVLVTGQSTESLFYDPYKRLLVAIPILLIMLLITLILKRFGINFVRITGWQVVSEKYQIDINTGDSEIYRKYLPAFVFVFLPLMLLLMVNYWLQFQIYGGVSYPSSPFRIFFN
ncbi:MAG: hypothetical protein ACYDEQ_12625, partial [Desulfocucumaceae bacterium]